MNFVFWMTVFTLYSFISTKKTKSGMVLFIPSLFYRQKKNFTCRKQFKVQAWMLTRWHFWLIVSAAAFKSTCCLPEPRTKHITAPEQHGILLYLPAASTVLTPDPPLLSPRQPGARKRERTQTGGGCGHGTRNPGQAYSLRALVV